MEESDDEEKFLYLSTCALLLIESKKRKRRFWQRQFLKKRKTDSSFYLLSQNFEDSSGFKNYFRVTPVQFEDILSKVGPFISVNNTSFREAIPAADKLAVKLRFLATGDSFTTLMYLHRISKSAICNIVHSVSAALVKGLAEEVKVSNLYRFCISVLVSLLCDEIRHVFQN
jgi:hypothetical protein